MRTRQQIASELKSIASTAEDAGRNFTASERTRVESLFAEMESVKRREANYAKGDAELRAAVDDLSRSLGFGGDPAHRGGSSKPSVWGDAFVKSLPDRFGRKELVPTGGLAVPALSTTIAVNEGRARRLLEAIPTEQMQGTDTYAFMREVTRTHAAAPVAKGTRKPTSTYELEKVEDRAVVIAHLTEPIARQDLDDVAALKAYVDDALREGVLLKVEDQVLNGDGTGENLTGIANTSGIQVQAYSATVTDLDPLLETTRKALTKLETVNIENAGSYVLHPNDWETIDLARTTKNPNNEATGASARQLHDRPVIVTSAATEGVGHLVDLDGSTRLWERDHVEVRWTEAMYDPDRFGVGDGGSLFEANQIQFLGEGRWGFGVTRPRGVVEIDLTAA